MALYTQKSGVSSGVAQPKCHREVPHLPAQGAAADTRHAVHYVAPQGYSQHAAMP